jgi:hypothetical protein
LLSPGSSYCETGIGSAKLLFRIRYRDRNVVIQLFTVAIEMLDGKRAADDASCIEAFNRHRTEILFVRHNTLTPAKPRSAASMETSSCP